MKNGDIIVCRSKSWLSKLIRWATNGSWSHTAVAAESWKKKGVIEAQKNGVNFKFLSPWNAKYGYEYILFRFNKKFDERELMLRAFSKAGETKYDFFTLIFRVPLNLFVNLFRRIFGLHEIPLRRRKGEDRAFICSEFTGWVWQLDGWEDMTPQDQYEYLTNSPDWAQIEKE